MLSLLTIPLRLISVEKQKNTSVQGRVRIFPLVFACMNIFFCGFFDQYLQNDLDGHYLWLFFFVQSAIGILFSIGFFKQIVEEILSKTCIFPLSTLDRFNYLLFNNLRRTLSAVWLLTTSLFLIVLYHREPITCIAAVIIFVLMVIALEALVDAALLMLRRSSRTIASAGIFALFLGFGMLVSSVVFHFHTVLREAPLVSWAAEGILAMQRSDLVSFGFNAVLMLSVLASTVFVVRKFT
jgi:hypothetical protein